MSRNFLKKSLRLILVVSSCATFTNPVPAQAGEAETTQVYLDNGQLEYVGGLDNAANRRLFALYDRLTIKPTFLSIRSLGGDVDPGMALGSWVHAHQLNVRVMEFCLSSCANYVFPAAAEKIVSNFAMIGFHGGPGDITHLKLDASAQAVYDALKPAEQKAFMDDLDKMTVQLGQKEAAYFRQIGVRADLSSLGQKARYEPVMEASPSVVGWTYSQAGFALLGVGNITVINPPWKPASPWPHKVFVSIPVAPTAGAMPD